MNYTYNKNLFREFLSYPKRSDLTLFEDKKRLDKLELLIMGYIDKYGLSFMLKEFEDITKNFYNKDQAYDNLKPFIRESDLIKIKEVI